MDQLLRDDNISEKTIAGTRGPISICSLQLKIK